MNRQPRAIPQFKSEAEEREFWQTQTPDIVVSLVPNFNRAMHQAWRQTRPTAPYVTILTDLADYPPHFWLEQQEQFVVCGTDRAVGQALALGHARERVFRVSGMILRPEFHHPRTVDRASERLRLGLEPHLATGLVLFGGQGSPAMTGIARHVARCRRPVQLVFLCGRNEPLRDRLRRLELPYPHVVEGFTASVPFFMQLSDFAIGKPGPGSLSEAVASQLPVIVERNVWTMPQERYNAEWLRQNGLGLVVPSFRQLAPAIDQLVDPDVLAGYRRRAASLPNRAVYEVADILAGLLRTP